MQRTIENNSLLEQYDQKINLYRSFVREIEHQITKILESKQINCNAIASRTKSRESLSEKIERKHGKYMDLSQITDIAGVRIITYYSEDVDKIAKIIESEFDVDQENSIDKREALEPDRFGYCSVHYVVGMSPQRLSLCEYNMFRELKCEIQIRSILQHAWAEIEHDIGYKNKIAIPKQMRRKFSRIAGLLEIADQEFVQIRSELEDYRKSAQSQITESKFQDQELDGVILDVMISSNEIVHQINKYISELICEPLVSVSNPNDYSTTIRLLNWFEIKTVNQLNDALIKYSEQAKKVASEKLKHSSNNHAGIMDQTVAFFYLGYAILLVNDYDDNAILSYLSENKIGYDYQKTLNELLRIKQSI